MDSLDTKVMLGELPDFWNRDILFFANLLSLFYGNRDEIKCLMDGVGGVKSYGGRLIPIINLIFQGGNNLLVLELPPNTALIRYFQDIVGLNLPRMEILSYSDYAVLPAKLRGTNDRLQNSFIDQIRGLKVGWIGGFVTDNTLTELARILTMSTINSLEVSKNGNNKLFLHNDLIKRGFPVFDTFIAESRQELVHYLPELHKKGYRKAVVKAQIGASGIGMVKLDTSESTNNLVPDHIFFEGPALLQGWLDDSVPDVQAVGSPSIQLFLDEQTVYLYDLTEQILDSKSIHQGNMAPPPYLRQDKRILPELIRQGSGAGSWLHQQGYRGTASIDFHVIKRKKRIEVRICEINARITGATYPSVLARRLLPHGNWLMRNLRFCEPITVSSLLNSLEKSAYLFKPDAPNGILPINFEVDGKNKIKKGQLLFLGENLQSCMALLKCIESVASVKWEYDRD